MRRRHRHLGRAVARGRADRRRGHQGSRPIKVLVAGAGIGGLAAALALLRHGIDVEVHEQAPELREVGAGLQLSANGTRVLYALGVGEALKALSCEAEGKEIRLWNTGEARKLFDLGAVSVERWGFPYLTVYRPDLLSVLADAVGHDRIHLGSRITGFVQSKGNVSIETEKKTYKSDVLIGADGIHSTVRQALFGPDKPQFTGVIAWRGVIPMDRLPSRMARRIGVNWVGPGGHVVHYPLRGATLMNFVGALERDDWRVESWSARGTVEEMSADFRGWHEDVQTLVRSIPTPHKWALMTRPPMPRWTEGRVTLLGDACHSMLPFLAQGAVMAIEDGYVLARALAAGGDVSSSLLKYENARRARTTKAVEGSAANIGRFHHRALADPRTAREYVEREWAGASVAERYEWLFTYDATTVSLAA